MEKELREKVMQNEQGLKELREKIMQNEENYPGLSFLKVLIYSSIPKLYALPLKYIALRDLRNGKEPFHGAKNPITKWFAYVTTLEFSGPLLIAYSIVPTKTLQNTFNKLDNVVLSIGRGIKKIFNKILGREVEELDIKMQPEELPLSRRSYSLNNIDKYYGKEIGKDEIKEKLVLPDDVKEKVERMRNNIHKSEELNSLNRNSYSLNDINKYYGKEINKDEIKEKLALSDNVKAKLERINTPINKVRPNINFSLE